MLEFVRYQSAVPNARGRFPGVFALANGLGRAGYLDPSEASWLRATNDRAEAAYADPSSVDPRCYDQTLNPGARSWFRHDADELFPIVEEYLAVLDRHSVPWVEMRTRTPGHVVYEDLVQVVAVPFEHPTDWPFLPATIGAAEQGLPSATSRCR